VSTNLPARREDQPPDRHRGQPLIGDYHHLETVVVVGFPVREARLYLNRYMGNRIGYKLVEARRGEALGAVREIQINLATGGDPIFVRQVRLDPDGNLATDFTPEDLIHLQAEMLTVDGRKAPALGPDDEIVLHVPVRSYLRFLPALFQGAPGADRAESVPVERVSDQGWGRELPPPGPATGGDPDSLRRFLFVFQHLMTTVLDRVEQIALLTNPTTADPRFLSWIASWVGFTLDESLPLHQQRELISRAIRLYRTRGTRSGVEEMVQVLTSARVTIAPRTRPRPFYLGGPTIDPRACATLAGGSTVSERYLRDEPPPHYLFEPERPATSFFELVLEPRSRFQRRFSERAPDVLRRLAQIVTAEKPVHVTFTIRFDEDR